MTWLVLCGEGRAVLTETSETPVVADGHHGPMKRKRGHAVRACRDQGKKNKKNNNAKTQN